MKKDMRQKKKKTAEQSSVKCKNMIIRKKCTSFIAGLLVFTIMVTIVPAAVVFADAENTAAKLQDVEKLYNARAGEITARSDEEQLKEITEITEALAESETVQGILPGLFLQRDFLIGYLENGGTFTEEQEASILRQIQVDANADMTSSILGNLCKDVLLLCAMDIDPCTCTVKADAQSAGKNGVDGEIKVQTINIIDKIAGAAEANLTIYNAPYVLLVYAANEKCRPENTVGSVVLTEDTVIRYILDNQAKDGEKAGSFGGKFANAGDTASVILGFAGYTDYESEIVKNAEITDSIEVAYDYILSSKDAFSSFGNVNYNAYVILAGSMLGKDPREITAGENGPDVIDALLSDSLGTDSGFKYGTSSKVNLMATADAMRALTAFRNYCSSDIGLKGNIYDFTDKELPVYENWPTGKILTDLFVAPPVKTLYKKGESLDTAGMAVTAKYSDGTIKTLADGEYQVSKLASTTTGTKEITVKYSETSYGITENKSAKFLVNVTDTSGSGSSGTQVSELKVSTTVKNADGKMLAEGTAVIKKDSTTVMDVLKQILAGAGITATIKGGYVVSIDGLSEFDMGGNSGWMVRVDGTLIETSSAQYKLKGGEKIEWFYTKDWTKVPGAGSSKNATVSTVTEMEIKEVIEKADKFLEKTVTNPAVSSIGGEWSIIARERVGSDVPALFTELYDKNAGIAIKETAGELDQRRITENARAVIAFTALGQDAANVYGYNLLLPLADMEKVKKQGLNGVIWTLIALDSGDYDIPQVNGRRTARSMLINTVLKEEVNGGGFSLSGGEADIDITAMTLTALAPYRNEENIKNAVERGIVLLSSKQNKAGGYTVYGSENSESTAQTVIALCTLGIDPASDKRFIKNGESLVDNLLSYQIEDGSFEHTRGGGSDLMATEQALLALAAYHRLVNSLSPLYDMTDTEGVSSRIEKDSVKIAIDGKQIEFTAYTGKPFIDEADRTLAPVRIITEKLGCDVSWNSTEKLAIITKDGTKVYIKAGSNEIIIEKDDVQKYKTIDTTAKVIDDRTYIPLRAATEALGYNIVWDNADRIVRIER